MHETVNLKMICILMILTFTTFLQINEAETQNTAVITGMVLNEENKPLAGAFIRVVSSRPQWTPKSVLTDSSGRFHITVDQEGTYSVYAIYDRPETEGIDYVPGLWTTSVQFGSTSVFTFVLEKGASLYVDEDIWFVESNRPTNFFRFTVVSRYGSPLARRSSIYTYGTGTDLVNRFKFNERLVVIPADSEVTISAYASIGTLSHTFTLKGKLGYFKLSQGESLHVDAREDCLKFNIEKMREMSNFAFSLLRETEDAGFLVTADRQDLLNSHSLIEASMISLKRGLYDECFAELRNAYILTTESLGRLQGLIQIGSQSALLLPILFVFIASASAYLTTERENSMDIMMGEKSRFSLSFNMLVAAGFYTLLIIYFYALFPGCHLVSQTAFTTTSILALIIGQAAVAVLPRVFYEKQSERRSIQFRSAVISAFSMACRNLRRRRLRTVLNLTTIMILVFGFVTLTSISPGYGLVTTSLRPALSVDAILVRDVPADFSSVFIPLPASFIAWIENQPNVTSIAPKAENRPVSVENPLGYLYTSSGKSILVLGIMGIIPSAEANFTLLNNTIVRGEYLKDDDVLGILLSYTYHEKLRIDVGDKIYGFGVDFVIRGFFSPDLLLDSIDVDGQLIVPYCIVPGTGPQHCSPDDVIIVIYNRALTMPKVVVSRVNVQLRNIQDYNDVAKNIALSREYMAYVSHTGSLYLQYVGGYIEEKGAGLIPLLMILVALNIAASILGSVKERRNEIASLSSVGLNPTHIMALFMAEAAVIGFIGGGLGYLSGISGYRIASARLFGELQVREKVSVEWGLLAIFVSGFAAILASVIPALQASTIVTPSLLRKWGLDEKERPEKLGQPWVIDLPVKLRPRELEPFLGFMQKRLIEKSVSSMERTSDVTLEEEKTVSGPLIRLSFKWLPGEESRRTQNEIVINQEEGKDYFTAKVICKPDINLEKLVVDSVSFVRKLIFEWDTITFEVATPFDPSISQLYTLVNAYTPTTLYIITQDFDISEKLQSLKRRIELEGLRSPRMVISRVNPLDLNQCTKVADEIVSNVDVVCISGGPNAVNTALALSAVKQKKMICYVVDPRPPKERVSKPFQILKIVNIIA